MFQSIDELTDESDRRRALDEDEGEGEGEGEDQNIDYTLEYVA
jgi:hypothetical protein